MIRSALAAVCCAVLTIARSAAGCSCGSPGLDSALTTRDEVWGVRFIERAELAQGTWDVHGAYRPLDAGDHDWSWDGSALVAIRPQRRLELSAQAGYGRSSIFESGYSDDLRGMTDLQARVRWEPLDQAPGWVAGSPFSLAFVTGVLAPTGRADPSLNRGLGAWEFSLGAVVDHYFSPWNRVSFSVEIGPRLPDHSLCVARQLGPRAFAQATASHWFTGAWAVSGFSSLRWEGDAAVDGRREAGSGSRLWQIGLGTTFQPSNSSVRPAFAVRYAPHVSVVDVDTTASTSLELSLSYER